MEDYTLLEAWRDLQCTADLPRISGGPCAWTGRRTLQEIFEAPFEAETSAFYHFYSDIQDFINSLTTTTIYSNKNNAASQIDPTAYRDNKDISNNQAYVCMTQGLEGKKRTYKHVGSGRPFGIAFKDLKALCNSRGYHFTPEQSYNQVFQKNQFSISQNKQGEPVPTAYVASDPAMTRFHDFWLMGIGQLENGQYFVSGGQGHNLQAHISSKLFDDSAGGAELYNKLKN